MHSLALGAIVVFLGRSKKWGSTGHVAADGKGPKGGVVFFARSQKNIEKFGKKCDWEWLRKSGLGDVYIDVAWYWIDLDSFNGFNLGAVSEDLRYTTLGFSKITVPKHEPWNLLFFGTEIYDVRSVLYDFEGSIIILRIRLRCFTSTQCRALCFFALTFFHSPWTPPMFYFHFTVFLNPSWEAM